MELLLPTYLYGDGMSRGFERFGPGSPPSQLPSRLKPYMELTIDTTLETGLAYTLPLQGTVDVTVDWGDGTQNSYTTTGDKTHTYAAEGVYHIRISGTLTGFGSQTYTGPANISKLTAIGSWGALGLTSLWGACASAANLTAVPSWLPSGVTTLRSMFSEATSINDPNIGLWDVSNVSVIYRMFRQARAFNIDLSSWNTGKVSDMREVFANADVFDRDIGGWDIAKMTTATNMFYQVTLSTANYDALLIGWEGQAVQNNVSFNGGSSKYTPGGAAEAARTALVDDHLWSIVDGGPVV